MWTLFGKERKAAAEAAARKALTAMDELVNAAPGAEEPVPCVSMFCNGCKQYMKGDPVKAGRFICFTCGFAVLSYLETGGK